MPAFSPGRRCAATRASSAWTWTRKAPTPERFRAAIAEARAAGCFVPFYYTVPDGHNPAGFSFSIRRREEILGIAREEGILIVEDAPYVYISYARPEDRPKPFLSLDPARTVHLFTGSKIGLPGPRVGFVYSEAELEIGGWTPGVADGPAAHRSQRRHPVPQSEGVAFVRVAAA